MRWMIITMMAMLLLVAACGKSVNWTERVGSYTMDQAVEDLGEPRSIEETKDGDIRWYWYESIGSEWDDVYILVFSPDGVLKLVERHDD